jgi:phosphatidylglycerol:prolipoprotein diacylglycerol transferase
VRTILFYIPAEVAGVPVLGIGWLLAAWIALCIGIAVYFFVRGRDLPGFLSLLPVLTVTALVIALVLPLMVERSPAGVPLGIPIRGFGVMLMLAMGSGVGLACYRAQQMGIHPEFITGLATVMIIAGLIGARLFYVVQYWDEFERATLTGTLQALFNFTKGGLVVYGSVIAGVPAGIWYLRRHGLPILAMGDIIAPSMVLGLALGRMGCFLNGCCFGGVCLPGDWAADVALTFPACSPPYIQQAGVPPYTEHKGEGWRSGIWLEERAGEIVAAYIAPAGPAAEAGLNAGDKLVRINGAVPTSLDDARKRLSAGSGSYEVELADGRILRWAAPSGPPRSVPIHATQLYAAIDGGLLALFLWLYYPFRRRDGEVFALLITLHPVSRFLLEMIRSDEGGQFGTVLTISQWLSIAILAGAAMLWWYILRQPRGSVLPQPVPTR